MDKDNRNSSFTRVVPLNRRTFGKINLGALISVIFFGSLVYGCLNPLQFVPSEDIGLVGGGTTSPSTGKLDPTYPPLASLAATPYEGALGLEWTWPQDAGPGDSVEFAYAPEGTELPAARAVRTSARVVAGEPLGDTFTLVYPQTATVINNLTPSLRYAVRGQVKYAGDHYSIGLDKIAITLNISITIDPSGPSTISAVHLDDFKMPAKYAEVQYVVISQDAGVYAIITWDPNSFITENTWDQDRGGRFGNITYAPLTAPAARVELFVFHTDAWAFADNVTVIHNGAVSTAGKESPTSPSRVFNFTGQNTGSSMEFYVKADGGSDYNPGTLTKPMLTLNGALQRVAAEKANGNNAEIVLTVQGDIGDWYERHSVANSGALISLLNLKVQIVGTGNAVIQARGNSGTGPNGLDVPFGIFKITNSTVLMKNIEIKGGNAPYQGGGIAISSGGSLILDHVNLHDNRVNDGAGGGISALDTTLTLIDSSVHDNEVSTRASGGGIRTVNSTVSVERSTIADNVGYGGTPGGLGGGGIYVQGGSLALRAGAIVENNTYYASTGTTMSDWSGGGIKASGTTVTMAPGVEVRYNTADKTHGGGIALTNSTLTMNGGRIHGNHVVNTRAIQLNAGGGGVYVGTNSTFTMNGGEIGGGQFAQPILRVVHEEGHYWWGDVTTDTNIYGMINHLTPPQANTADVNGAGVFVEGTNGGLYPSGTFTMTGGTISLNEAIPLVFGGENFQTLQLRYTTRGGGIFVQEGGHLTMNKNTGSVVVTENIATYGGGIYTKAAVDIERTFWGGESTPTGSGPTLFATVRIINNYALGGGENDPWTDYVTSGGGGHNVHVWYEESRDGSGIDDPRYNVYGNGTLADHNHYKLGYPVDPRDDRYGDPLYAGYYDTPSAQPYYYDAVIAPNYFPLYPYYWINDEMSAINRGGADHFFEADNLPFE
jgi:predicted outer membrane repeat protein